jgi:hypothetical protein
MSLIPHRLIIEKDKGFAYSPSISHAKAFSSALSIASPLFRMHE